MSYERLWSRKIHPKNQVEILGLKKPVTKINNTKAEMNDKIGTTENESVSEKYLHIEEISLWVTGMGKDTEKLIEKLEREWK